MPTQNETGEEIIDWHHAGTVWAEIEPLSGTEALRLNVNLAEINTRLNVRWSQSMDGIDTKWRARDLSENGRIYNLQHIADVHREHKRIEILARSGANEG
jgi:SPP1 family predicted phage head-tail adaptor